MPTHDPFKAHNNHAARDAADFNNPSKRASSTHLIPIVGNSYRDREERAAFDAFCSGELEAQLRLEARPDNQFDPLAIAVHIIMEQNKGDYHVGYVPRNKTHIIHDAWEAVAAININMQPNSNMMEVTIDQTGEM